MTQKQIQALWNANELGTKVAGKIIGEVDVMAGAVLVKTEVIDKPLMKIIMELCEEYGATFTIQTATAYRVLIWISPLYPAGS